MTRSPSRVSDRYEVRLAGEGGQGLITAGLILAEAAAIYGNRNAVMTQTYGAATRGGPSRSEVIIAAGDINYPKVLAVNLLLAMSQDAYDNFAADVAPGGIVIVDSNLVRPTQTAHGYPITDLARRATGREITASILALGVICALSRVAPLDALVEAVRVRSPRDSAPVNIKALMLGYELPRRTDAASPASQKED